MSRFIVYALVDPRTDEVRYVGQSSRGEERPLDHGIGCHLRADCTHKGKWIRALRAAGYDYAIRVLEIVSAETLNSAEVRWIAHGRAEGWPLTNHTDGGEGLKNPTPETRAKLTANNIARSSVRVLQTPEARAKAKAALQGLSKSLEMRASLAAAARKRFAAPGASDYLKSPRKRGSKRSAETCAKISAALSGKKRAYVSERNRSPEMRAKVSAALKGKAKTESHVQRMADAHRGHRWTEEQRHRHSAWASTRRHSPETREKIAAANRRAHNRPASIRINLLPAEAR